MYDIHAHILPEIDDGARTREEALEMARVAEEDGTRLIMATPHRRDVEEAKALGRVQDLVTELNQELAQQGREIRLALGMENHLSLDLPDAVREGRALTLNGSRYVLVELPFFHFPRHTSTVLFQLQVQGLIPVLVHPERQAQIQQDPELLAELVGRGVLAQLTAGSLLGNFGRKAQRSARRLLERHLAHALASDCHRPWGKRSPLLTTGVMAAARVVGEEDAQAMVGVTPCTWVKNLPFTPPELLPPAPGRRWAFWR